MLKKIIKEIICSVLTISILVTCIYMILESYKAGVNYQRHSEILRVVWNEHQQYKLSGSPASMSSSTFHTLSDWRVASEQGFPWFINILYAKDIKQQEQQNLRYLCDLQRHYRAQQQQENKPIEFDREAFKDVPKEVFDPESMSVLLAAYSAIKQKDWQKIDQINCVGVAGITYD